MPSRRCVEAFAPSPRRATTLSRGAQNAARADLRPRSAFAVAQRCSLTGAAMKPVPLRRRLLLLAAVAILPLALMSGVALQALLEQQRLQSEQSSLDLVRAPGPGVDPELRRTVPALQPLALTEPITSAGTNDLASAHEFARRALASRPEWRAVLLTAPDGAPLFNTGSALGETTPTDEP